jgi:hypothetical protein
VMEKREPYGFDIEKEDSALGAGVVMAALALGISVEWAA